MRPRTYLMRLALAVTALVVVPAAHANVDQAQQVAYTVFPQVAQVCPQGVTVEEGPLFNAGAGAEAYLPPDCRVRFATLAHAYGHLCTMMVHEWGHLTGLGHSDDPGDVMHATGPHHPACGPEPPNEQLNDLFEVGELDFKRELLNDRIADLKPTLRAAVRRCNRTGRCAAEHRLWSRLERLLVRRVELG